MVPCSTPNNVSYDADFYAWTQEQVKLLRDRQWSQVDLPHVIEEIESLGKQQRQELRNRLSVLMGHLLKWHYQPQHRSRSWLAILRIQRLEIMDLLEDSPSLKPYLSDVLPRAYQKGIELVVKKNGASTQHLSIRVSLRPDRYFGRSLLSRGSV